jgi:hypothetical protein
MYFSNEDIVGLRDGIYIRRPRRGSKEAESEEARRQEARRQGGKERPYGGDSGRRAMKLTWVQHGRNVAAIWFARMAQLLFPLLGTLDKGNHHAAS